jgi:hypothetical protein
VLLFRSARTFVRPVTLPAISKEVFPKSTETFTHPVSQETGTENRKEKKKKWKAAFYPSRRAAKAALQAGEATSPLSSLKS